MWNRRQLNIASTGQVTDFGLAHHTPHSTLMTSGCGTVYYQAPEVLRDQAYSRKVDLWSLGVILFKGWVDSTELILRTISSRNISFKFELFS